MLNNKIKILFAIALIALCINSTNAQINLLADYINFRDYYSGTNTTYHYGDFYVDGGSGGQYWGWVYCNGIATNGYASINGNMSIYGSLNVYGTKNFVQPHPTDSTKKIVYVAVEAGEALTIARGTATTINGQAEITLPEHFSLVTSADAPLTVLITPKNAPVQLFVKDESKEKIIVAMKNTDFSEYRDVSFSYQVTGVRDGFEDHKAICEINSKDDDEIISPKRMALLEKVKKIAAIERGKIKLNKIRN